VTHVAPPGLAIVSHLTQAFRPGLTHTAPPALERGKYYEFGIANSIVELSSYRRINYSHQPGPGLHFAPFRQGKTLLFRPRARRWNEYLLKSISWL
jgi:hypothetical protein